MIVYISGPMTGLPEHNYPAFDREAARLRAEGHAVINPARPGPDGWEWSDYMRRALTDIAQCDAIAMLPGWERSAGATLERHIATQLGYDVIESIEVSA